MLLQKRARLSATLAIRRSRSLHHSMSILGALQSSKNSQPNPQGPLCCSLVQTLKARSETVQGLQMFLGSECQVSCHNY